MSQLQIIDDYINAVRQEVYNLLPQEEFLSALRADLTEYQAQFPESTFDDLVLQFGNPAMVAKDFVDNMIDATPQKLARGKWKRKMILVTLIVLLAAVVVYCILISMQTQGDATDVIIIHEGEATEEAIE